jgi:hypothetical protein
LVSHSCPTREKRREERRETSGKNKTKKVRIKLKSISIKLKVLIRNKAHHKKIKSYWGTKTSCKFKYFMIHTIHD